MQHPDTEHVTAKSPKTDAEHVSIVEPSIAQKYHSISRRIQFSVLLKQHPDTPDTTAGRKNAPNFQVGTTRERNAGIHPETTVD